LRSRGSTSAKPEILVDTTFLLPALGLDVEEEAMNVIPLFRRVKVYYLEVGILEAMWKILKLIPPHKFSRVKLGIDAVRNTYHSLEPRAEAYVYAATIYHEGHRDYIDALHYASAKTEEIPFLTIDYEFRDFLKEHEHKVEGIVITPKELRNLINSGSRERA